MLHTILVPLDGSTFARHALPAALSIARRTGAAVKLAHVHVPDTGYTAADHLLGGARGKDAPATDEQRSREMNYLTARCCELVANDVDAGCTLLDGPVVAGLIEHAQAIASDLVIMTTHGRGAFSRAWLGSVVDGVVRHSPVPTLLIRPRYAAENMAPGDDQPWDAGRVLVPLDGSSLAEHILEPAATLAGAMDAELLLVRIAPPLAPPSAGSVVPAPESTATHPAYAAERSYLDAVAENLRARGLAVRTRIEAAQHTAPAILDVAREEHCDLIALATHGRGGLARVVIGSVADKVVRGAELPVLLLRP